MRSPKFIFSEKSISECTGPAQLKKAWQKKIKGQLRQQILWDVIDFRDVEANLDQFISTLSSEIISANYRVSKPHTYLVEKSRGMCRQMTLVQPRDLIVLQCLSSRLYAQILSNSPSKAAFFEPGDMNWSTGKMTITDGDYGSVASWKKFQKQVLKFSKENNFVVIADVANFYDFINFKHLRNIVSSLCNDVDEAILDFLIYLLNDLSWVPDYMPRQEMGMPQIEAEAPRVLANAMLFELDRVVELRSYKNYARFMDDIDFGVQTIVEAKRAIRDIDLTLQSRQLRLNAAKTKILSQKEAFRHFCVEENATLDRYSNLLQNFVGRKIWTRFLGLKLEGQYENWLNRSTKSGPHPDSVFLRGNGAKVHKRILTLMRRCEIKPPVDDMIWLVKQSPSMRDAAFLNLLHNNRPNDAFNKCLSILKSGTFVDDAAYIEFSRFCVNARFRRTAKLMDGLEAATEVLNKQGLFGAYGATLILARISTPEELYAHAKSILPLWKSDFWLGRCVAGLYPRIAIRGGKLEADFIEMIKSTGNSAALQVISHHNSLMTDPKFVDRAFAYLKHDNESLPLKISLPKALQILSVKKNSASAKKYADIVARHPALSADAFFKLWGF